MDPRNRNTEGAKTKIIDVLKDPLAKEIITEEEYATMNPEDKDAAKF